MYAIAYSKSTGDIAAIVPDAVVEGDAIVGRGMRVKGVDGLLQIETDPGEIANISELAVEVRLAGARAAKKAEIASARYAAEIAGVTVGGVTARTDRESQALITGAALKAMQDATYTCRWKTESGFVTLDSATIIAVADAVRSHVQGCFDAEDAKCVLIDAAATVEAVEAVEW